MLDGAVYVAVAGFLCRLHRCADPRLGGLQRCGGIATFCGVVSNAGAAEIKGIEFETNARLGRDMFASGDQLRFQGSLGWIDAEYTQYITNIGGVPTDVADLRKVQNTPEWTGSATLGYTTPVGSGDLYLGSTVSYRSETTQFEVPNPFLDQPGYALVDASIVWTSADSGFSLGLYGRNLTDKEYRTSGYTFVAGDPPVPTLGTEGTLTAFYGNPRQVYLTATIEF